MTKYWLGKKLSKETKRKISRTLKAKGIKPPSQKGVKYSKEYKERMSKKLKGRIVTWGKKISEGQKGSKGSNWQGGKTEKNKLARRSFQFLFWRKQIFERDNYTCRKCHVRGGSLHPHHVLNFSEHVELRFKIDNGVTLCSKHHAEFHKTYGLKNNNLGQLLDYLK